ncbi:thiamine phosphate synthase [Clostridium sp. 19966]|uniref:thiamine phosphate synthase n=1 Tax=Clostridium sp. 19966 TaxID=2768166 RepID=UPI0028DE8A91|nr:thiamine phosphate synthase [Clostridium sp. 19966]MDT8718922.1 thiamine phosphate synthase [Clostridium sp. 19966]
MIGKIFAITNRKLLKNKTLGQIIEESVEGGADAIILREKDLPSEALYEIALKAKIITDNRSLLIINGNYEVANRVKADGIQLSYEAFMNFQEAFNGLKGVSIHSLKEAVAAEKKGADYVIAGHIFNTACKRGLEGRGMEFLETICHALTIPVIAVGGINSYNLKEVLNTGAQGAAFMSSVMENERPLEYLKSLRLAIL